MSGSMAEENSSRTAFIGVFSVLGILVLAVVIRFFVTGGGEGPSKREMPPTPVVVADVMETEFADVIEAIGTARANESVNITAKITDTIRSISFVDGQFIEKGEIIVELTDEEASANLEEARAGLEESRKQYNRISGLMAGGSTTRSRLDQALGDRDRARARVQALEASLADRIIRAPFAGVLGLRNISPGTLVKPGDVITTLDDISLVKIDFSVPERFISALKSGQTISALSAAYPERAFVGTVSTVDSRVDPITRAVVVRAEVPNPGSLLRGGMSLSIRLATNQRLSLTIPEDSIVPVSDKVFVYVVGPEGIAKRTRITVNRRRVGEIEVLEGLSLNDRVVVEGTHKLFMPQQPVRVVGQTKPETSDDPADAEAS